ncbi:MAG: hypothetical protein FWF08_03925 [Oscillospiraceae bacterium]|nr:hypothetical protein [Oscillospiraceae bacterium]
MAKNKQKKHRILKRAFAATGIALATLIILLIFLPFAGSIGMEAEQLPPGATKTLKRAVTGERWMTGAGRLLDGFARMPKNIPDASGYESLHFYPGGESAGEGESWFLGYAQAAITPQDFESRDYYVGGNLSVPPRRFGGKLDELKVRVIALSDGGGDAQNINIFAAIDSIGITNRQVRDIRALVADMELQSVNIASTHCHSAVDSTGIYSKGGRVDEAYVNFLNEKTAEAIREAVRGMEAGRLYISRIGSNSMEGYDSRFWDKMGFDDEKDEWDEGWSAKWVQVHKEMLLETSIEEYGLGGYISNRRMHGFYPTKLNRLRFEPLDPSAKETVLLNFAAHPYTAGYKYGGWPGDRISGDYIYYMEEVFDSAGMNFLFINGAVNGINPNRGCTADRNWYEEEEAGEDSGGRLQDWQIRRIGRDFAGIALAMTMEPGDIAADPLTDPDNDHGYEYRNIMAMIKNNGNAPETELEPNLSIRLKEARVDIGNPVIRWAAKKGLLNLEILRDGKKLTGNTEIGYMELGGEIAVALMPGEFTPGLAWGGGDTTAERAIRMRGFGHPTFSESAGSDVLVFGLCNDEIGYVIPDGDYCMFYVPRGIADRVMGTWDYDHYAELLSPGPRTAGVIADEFAALVKLANKN